MWHSLLTALSAAVLAGACGGPHAPVDDAAGPPNAETRAVVDMRGAAVTVPRSIGRVATINDGFVEGVMTRLGVIRTLMAVGSSSQQRVWSYTYPATAGASFTVADGMGTMRVLHPWIGDLPCASQAAGDAVNYETIAAARPDVVIARIGDCTIGTAPEGIARMVAVFASMRIPLVVLRSTTDYRDQGVETLHAEIEVLGRLFGKEEEARALADELSAAEALIQSRVADVPVANRPRALYLGLASGARASGGAAYVWGTDTTESWMLERIVGARNAYRGPGARVLLNAEQILALDPDVIFLPTSAGYHPPEELEHAPYFKEFRHLRAVREHRIYALPWSPMNCARRLEYPLDLLVMAKASYPDRFSDLAVHTWALEFYRRTYGVDEPMARALRRAQWLDWSEAAGF